MKWHSMGPRLHNLHDCTDIMLARNASRRYNFVAAATRAPPA
jgi:hypothetical protein